MDSLCEADAAKQSEGVRRDEWVWRKLDSLAPQTLKTIFRVASTFTKTSEMLHIVRNIYKAKMSRRW